MGIVERKEGESEREGERKQGQGEEEKRGEKGKEKEEEEEDEVEEGVTNIIGILYVYTSNFRRDEKDEIGEGGRGERRNAFCI